ncbi:MAG: phosphotransferase [Bacteroides sp.]|nr:phosphotransferase [Bacteroides sp.]
MENIRQQFREWKGFEPSEIRPLSANGSSRRYFRIAFNGQTVLGAFNRSVPENEAYFSFTQQFLQEGLPVPRVLHVAAGRQTYFVEDLGDDTLFSLLPKNAEVPVSEAVREVYFHVIEDLVRFQTAGLKNGQGLDYTHVFPVADFDRAAMMWDLNYFKYSFLKVADIPFDEAALEADFDRLCAFLNREPHKYFMYRDFQSRNIMVRGNAPWFIDFQGGRKGPLGYDLASLLYDAKASLPDDFRCLLLEQYLQAASREMAGFDGEGFCREFYACVLLRILQAMGAYGLRGICQKKDLFLKSIPYAIRNLSVLRRQGRFAPYPEIERVIAALEGSHWAEFANPRSEKLTLHLCSFSFKKGLPPCGDGHGGGFVFDCRFLPNPGRLERYKNLTGRNAEVQDFFADYPEMDAFLQNCLALLKPAVSNYIERGFESLSIAFGCTGGQHRSVYCAEKMKTLLERNFDVKVELVHLVHPE